MEEEITLSEILAIIKNKMAIIISISILGLLLSALFTFFVVTPTYESTTQLLVNRRAEDGVGVQLNDITTNVQMIDTYKDIISGPVILKDVKENLDTELTTDQIRDMVEITANANSQVFSLTITSENPTEAASIANEIATTFQDKIGSIMNVDNVTIISQAVVNPQPVSPNVLLNLALGLVFGLMLGVGISFLQAYFDDTIKGNSFVKEKIGWSDLGSITVFSEDDKKEIEWYFQSKKSINKRNRVI